VKRTECLKPSEYGGEESYDQADRLDLVRAPEDVPELSPGHGDDRELEFLPPVLPIRTTHEDAVGILAAELSIPSLRAAPGGRPEPDVERSREHQDGGYGRIEPAPQDQGGAEGNPADIAGDRAADR